MGEKTAISWTHHTFNPWRGCIKIAPECHSCYADKLSKRNPGTLGVWGSEASGGVRVVGSEDYWQDPEKWEEAARKSGERRRVFCASLADIFEKWSAPLMMTDRSGALYCSNCGAFHSENCDYAACDCGWNVDDMFRATMDDARQRLFWLIDATPNIDWLILTKRPDNVRSMWPAKADRRPIFPGMPGALGQPTQCIVTQAHRPNVWLGTSAGTQESAERLIPELVKCKSLAARLFVSCEPMLGPVSIFDAILKTPVSVPKSDLRIDWLIVGCESNGKSVGRLGEFESELAWWKHAAILRDQCKAAGVAFFMKQLPLDGKVVHEFDPFHFPQEFPSAV